MERPKASPVAPDVLPATPVTDAERSAVSIVSLDLNVHLDPNAGREETRATVIVRNTTGAPILRIPLQISSSLRWEAVSLATPDGLRPMPWTQSPIATDADHTGYAQEAILIPAQPLAAGAAMTLSVFYGGEIRQSSARLEVLGAPPERAARTDWDAILPTTDSSATALRGFGNVLWYPVAAPTAVLGDGNRLFEAVARERDRNAGVAMRLRLTVDYVGDPPDAAIFDGQVQPLAHAADSDDQLIGETRGIATADFPFAPIGRRTPSLFLTAQHAVTTPNQLLTVITPHAEAIAPYAEAAANLQPLLNSWLGETPTGPLVILDHAGEPYEDGGFLAIELASSTASEIAPQIVRGLAHAWLPLPATAWLDQGIPEFMSLLWTEQSEGREAAIAKLQHASVLIALAEPADAAHADAGQPLVSARSDVYLHFKSAAVLWQLRELLGEERFRAALTGFRHSVKMNPKLGADPAAFERSIEATSKVDLGWFFHDWVDRDPGLPDLTIVQATPRLLPARPGKSAGYLVAVEVRNDGDAVADVPVTVRSGTLTSTERLRIPAHSLGSTRVLFESSPETLQVNDGSVPELRSTIHTLPLSVTPAGP